MEEIYKILAKNSSLMEDVLDENDTIDFLSTNVVTLNLLFSGKIDGGIPLGKVSQIAAPPSLGKSFVGLTLLKNAQHRGMYTVVIDTENAFDFSFAKKVGIDTSPEKFIAISNNQIEEVQQRIIEITDIIPKKERKDKIFILLDSFGNLQTQSTMDNARKGRDVRDMSITQKKNNLSRILSGTKATIFIINHTYANIGGWGDPMSIPGGNVLYHNCSSIVLAKSKAKEENSKKVIVGDIITSRTYKSRFSKERSNLKFRIKKDKGLDIFYGLLDDALEHGCVIKPKNGYYTRPHVKDDKNYRETKIYTSDFWLPIFKDTDFRSFLEDKYLFKEDQELDVKNINLNEELNK